MDICILQHEYTAVATRSYHDRPNGSAPAEPYSHGSGVFPTPGPSSPPAQANESIRHRDERPLIILPLIAHLEVIQACVPGKMFSMLKHANDNPRSDSLFFGKVPNGLFTVRMVLNKPFPIRLRNKNGLSPVVRLSFEIGITGIILINKDIPFAV